MKEFTTLTALKEEYPNITFNDLFKMNQKNLNPIIHMYIDTIITPYFERNSVDNCYPDELILKDIITNNIEFNIIELRTCELGNIAELTVEYLGEHLINLTFNLTEKTKLLHITSISINDIVFYRNYSKELDENVTEQFNTILKNLYDITLEFNNKIVNNMYKNCVLTIGSGDSQELIIVENLIEYKINPISYKFNASINQRQNLYKFGNILLTNNTINRLHMDCYDEPKPQENN